MLEEERDYQTDGSWDLRSLHRYDEQDRLVSTESHFPDGLVAVTRFHWICF